MANAGRGEGEVALSSQRDTTICNRTPTPDNNVGYIRGELYPLPQNTGAQIQFMLTDLAKIIRLLGTMTRTCLKVSSLTYRLTVLARAVERARPVLLAQRLLLGRLRKEYA